MMLFMTVLLQILKLHRILLSFIISNVLTGPPTTPKRYPSTAGPTTKYPSTAGFTTGTYPPTDSSTAPTTEAPTTAAPTSDYPSTPTIFYPSTAPTTGYPSTPLRRLYSARTMNKCRCGCKKCWTPRTKNEMQ